MSASDIALLWQGLDFDWPWMALIMPLPWLLRFLLPPLERDEAVRLHVPALAGLEASIGLDKAQRRSGFAWSRLGLMLLFTLFWLSLVIAAMRPMWLGELQSLELPGRRVMLAVDVSGSMSQQDMDDRGSTRLDVVKQVAGRFIEQRQGDRIGLIVFGDWAYLQSPLSFDRHTVEQFLQETAIGIAGRNTAIGDAIGLAIKRLRHQQGQGPARVPARADDAVLILLTDGRNTAGRVDPIQSARLAAQVGLKIYTIGVGGTPRDAFAILRQMTGQGGELDEASLKAIAKATGGRYFRAGDEAELEQVYDAINALEAVKDSGPSSRPRHSLIHWPLALSLMLSTLLVGFWAGRWRLGP